jgi:hypothetical protein
MLTVAHVVIDCTNAAELAGFWSAALSHPVDEGAGEYFATVGRAGKASPVLMFLKVPEPKAGKNRLHIDLHGPDWAAEVDRLVSLGATKQSSHREYGTEWVTLTDPEGNEFDLGGGLSA